MTLLWIPLTIIAAFLQNVRSMLQKQLKDQLGTVGAAFVRFGYGFPFALLYLLGLTLFTKLPIPYLNISFFAIVMHGIQQLTALVKKPTITNDYRFFPPYSNALIFFPVIISFMMTVKLLL